MLEHPIRIMDSLAQREGNLSHPKYMMYSSHDTQVGIVWEWLNFTNFNFDYIPYASFLQMELYENKQCKENNSEKCFNVLFTANGHEL